MLNNQSEIAIIGGGVVGLSVAIGLLQSGHKIIVYDGEDSDARASFGNFGLVWGQGKGWNFAPYAKLTVDAIAAWEDFSKNLNDLSGLDVSLDQNGGFEFFTDPDKLNNFISMLEIQKGHAGNRFNYEALSGDELRNQIPGIGSKVVGATFSQLDGHINPLRFLRALRRAVKVLGGQIKSNSNVKKITSNKDGGFSLILANGSVTSSEKVILCAGLGAIKLADQLAFKTNIRPERGELLITEKLGDQLPFISSTIRQVDEGGIQIGGTHADVGMDDNETLDSVINSLKSTPELEINFKEAPLAKMNEIILVHPETHIKKIFSNIPKEGLVGVEKEPYADTMLCPNSRNAILRSCGAVIAAADELMLHNERIFCATRPPGVL